MPLEANAMKFVPSSLNPKIGRPLTLIRLESARFLQGLCAMRWTGKVMISKTSATARMVFSTTDTHHDSGL